MAAISLTRAAANSGTRIAPPIAILLGPIHVLVYGVVAGRKAALAQFVGHAIDVDDATRVILGLKKKKSKQRNTDETRGTADSPRRLALPVKSPLSLGRFSPMLI